jgi:hypothetical protein
MELSTCAPIFYRGITSFLRKLVKSGMREFYRVLGAADAACCAHHHAPRNESGSGAIDRRLGLTTKYSSVTQHGPD